MAELSSSIHQQIAELCQRGDALVDDENYAGGRESYWGAFKLLPEPREQWEAATWILGAIGDAHFAEGDYAGALHALGHAMHCPDAIGNPFLHLRLGQCQLELGNLERAAEELARAYMGAGREVFDAEDPKYLAFLSTRIEPPEGQEAL
jgi:tetratricopeptide (TPR) repeat protein